MGFDDVNEMGFHDDKRSTVISDGGRRTNRHQNTHLFLENHGTYAPAIIGSAGQALRAKIAIFRHRSGTTAEIATPKSPRMPIQVALVFSTFTSPLH
ncbi:uncharacterized protein G2W53_034443 [Senna tora]|uniref:Uncharacterized protein n=1 Tax=Senna tora TaxID=362788 RepID=A0A834T448_9FABA|nr:uncharacterized protein G2W53_034443 [Senna tora]